MLVVAVVTALVWVNVAPSSYHDVFTHDVRHWINEGLMTIFFVVVGMEIEREVLEGELRDPRAALPPAIAALGGMVVPALLFLAITAGAGVGRGWAIPMATDIAFAVSIMAIFAARLPAGLSPFLLTLAIVEEIGAILVIELF